MLPPFTYDIPNYLAPPAIERPWTETADCAVNEKAMLIGFPAMLMSGGVSYINSVQQVSITIAAGTQSGTATISAVSALAFIVFQNQQFSSANDGNYNDFATVTLTSPTVVTASKGTNTGTYAVTVNAAIVDPTSNLVDTVQFGTVALANTTSNTTPITSVDLTRSVVFWLGQSSPASSPNGLSMSVAVSLSDSTHVQAVSNTAAGVGKTVTTGFVVVQFKAAALNSNVQQYSLTVASGSTSTDTQNLSSSITATKGMLAYGGWTTSYDDGFQNTFYLTLGNTSVVATRQGTGIHTALQKFTVIEFKPAVIAQNVQRGTVALSSSQTTKTASITSAASSKTLANYLGSNFGNATGFVSASLGNMQQQDATHIVANRFETGSVSFNLGYEAITFN